MVVFFLNSGSSFTSWVFISSSITCVKFCIVGELAGGNGPIKHTQLSFANHLNRLEITSSCCFLWLVVVHFIVSLLIKSKLSSPLSTLCVRSICVPRSAKEATGALVSLEAKDGSHRNLVINVEYNQLDPVLRATVNPNVCYASNQPACLQCILPISNTVTCNILLSGRCQ